jgi:hypothetical protein
MVEAEPDIQAALDRTAELMAGKALRPIFEATFLHQDVLVRVDILEPDGHGAWRAIEVKASGRVKAYQLADVATQVWVMRGCGVHITQAIVRHLDGPMNWQRPDIAAVRFRDSDVTNAIGRQLTRRSRVATAASCAINGPEIVREIGAHCERPFQCEFRVYCSEAQKMPLLGAMR